MILIPLGYIKEDKVPNLNVIDCYSSCLVSLIAAREGVPQPRPLNISPWVAMSLLQKAIRRGDATAALSGAATLLRDAPERLWRRLGCIAFEDIGVADIACLGLVTTALTGKAFRKRLGGEWAVASLVVQLMADAPKNRSADDLLMTIAGLPSLTSYRDDFARMSDGQLRKILLGCPDVHKRGMALWFLVGTKRCPSPNLPPRSGNVDAAFHALAEHGVAPSMIHIARQGFRKTGEILAPFTALLTLASAIRGERAQNDTMQVQRRAGEVPSYALDTYTREGKQTFARFLKANAGTIDWMKANLPSNGRSAFLGELVFRVEGGCLANRWAGEAADQLREQYELGCLGISIDQAKHVLSLMRDDMHALDRIRVEVMGEQK